MAKKAEQLLSSTATIVNSEASSTKLESPIVQEPSPDAGSGGGNLREPPPVAVVPLAQEPSKGKPSKDKENPLKLSDIRLDQNFANAIPATKRPSKPKVRRPPKQEFFRVHSSPEYSVLLPMIIDEGSGQYYVISPEMRPFLAREEKSVMLYTAVTAAGTLFLLPVRVPGFEEKDNPWWRSLHRAAEAAKKGWVRVMSNQKEGEYEIYDPDKPETLGEVDWSKYPPFQEVDSTTQCIIE
jgi:hypothetical protein